MRLASCSESVEIQHLKYKNCVIGDSALYSFSCYCLVYPDGRVCISILHAPGDDPMGYETSAERWSPVQSVEKILLSVVSLLAGLYDNISCSISIIYTSNRIT